MSLDGIGAKGLAGSEPGNPSQYIIIAFIDCFALNGLPYPLKLLTAHDQHP
jgi:hypothetical protein